MKKVMFSGVMALLVGTSAAVADDSTTLTTKNYVDDGLRYVYGRKQDNLTETQMNAVNSGITAAKVSGYDAVESAVNDATTGLATKAAAADLDALEARVDTLDNLGTENLENNKTYVLKTNAQGEGSWSELEVVTSWDNNNNIFTQQP